MMIGRVVTHWPGKCHSGRLYPGRETRPQLAMPDQIGFKFAGPGWHRNLKI